MRILCSVLPLLTMLLTLAGCDSGPQIGEVEGQVKVDGRPLPQALVEFHPDGTMGFSSRAETDTEGRFTLRFSLPNGRGEKEGAQVGNHVVIVLDLKAANDPNGGRPRFAPQFSQIGQSPIRKEVAVGKQTINVDVSVK